MTARISAMIVIAAALTAISATRSPAQTESPLAQFPGFGHGRASEQARLVQQTIARERAIVRCMDAAGFQYTPKPPLVNPRVERRTEARPSVDPNLRYVGGLTPERRTAYNMALYGVPDPNDQQNLWDPRSATGGGCWGDAMRAVPSVFAARGQLSAQYSEMRRAVVADPRVQAARARWAECMAGRGHTGHGSPEDLLSAADRAAVGGAPPAQVQAHAQALTVARECRTTADLDGVTAAVRVEREAAFVNAHRAVLEQHRERQRNQVLPPE